VLARARAAAPEAFDADGRPLNLVRGEWGTRGHPRPVISPVDGTLLTWLPMLDLPEARDAVRAGADEARAWGRVDLDERRRRVAACLDELQEHRELLAYLLVWEIGKPFRQSLVEVDRTISGVRWYVDEIERLQARRTPVGLVSNVASWNYPLSVLVHAMPVQVLCGNASIAKTPTDGGLVTLTVALGMARRQGLPVSLVSGSGARLSEALVRSDAVGAVAFVGGKENGRVVAAGLEDRGTRHMLEMEGVNAYGVWGFSDWPDLAAQIHRGFEYAKQRCTAYVRWVVERRLFPDFLGTYLGVVTNLRIGHPLLVADPDDPPPDVDFGPLISARQAEDLRERYEEAVTLGALMLHRGRLDDSRLLPDQDTSAYFRPVALVDVPRNCSLYHEEPFGPVDTFVVVDRLDELIAEMNVSNGALVASIATDDPVVAATVSGRLRAFKVGVNRVRSRGDREEAFGGLGESWRGAFVGGEHLVRAVTTGEGDDRLYGTFPHGTLLPERR
jgi:acyl-CoA reductase-like NAD-dependent aldehyde dehydrogenase